MLSVCTDCPDRCVGCHGRCEKYIAERAERDRIISERSRQRRTEYDMCGYDMDKRERLKKARHKKDSGK